MNQPHLEVDLVLRLRVDALVDALIEDYEHPVGQSLADHAGLKSQEVF